MGTSDDKLTALRSRKRPDLAVMTRELLDEFKLYQTGQLCHTFHENVKSTHLVTVPVFDHPILSNCPEVVTSCLLLEHDAHDSFIVRKNTLVTVSKVQTPDFDVLVGGTGYKELAI